MPHAIGSSPNRRIYPRWRMQSQVPIVVIVFENASVYENILVRFRREEHGHF